MILVLGNFTKLLAEFNFGSYWFSNLTAICEPIVYIMWEPRHPRTLWSTRPVTGIALQFLFIGPVQPTLGHAVA
jgi:hypothetical protein